MPLKLRAALTVLSACGLLAAGTTLWMGSRQKAHHLELLRLENQTLAQELQLLRQQLEAERILAAARIRRLESLSPTPHAP